MTLAAPTLAAVLAEIAAIEGEDGYEGPKITPEIEAIRDVAADFDEQQFDDDDGNILHFPRQWVDDVVIGAIGRACDANGWEFYPQISSTRRYSCMVWRIAPPRISERFHARGESLALAAALAWLAAITEDRR